MTCKIRAVPCSRIAVQFFSGWDNCTSRDGHLSGFLDFHQATEFMVKIRPNTADKKEK